MNQKHVVIIFIIIALVGLGAMGFELAQDRVDKELTPIISPSPTPQLPEELIFRNNQSPPPNLQLGKKQVKQYSKFPGVLKASELKDKKAVIETSKGNIELEIYPEATKAASNFIFLSQDGFYNDLTFHRVEPGFVIQGGDPRGDGSGGPGYQFEDEPVTKKYDEGIVAMANAGPDTNGSQFFIMLADNPSLPPKYTIFGKVINGMETVKKIQVGDIMEEIFVY